MKLKQHSRARTVKINAIDLTKIITVQGQLLTRIAKNTSQSNLPQIALECWQINWDGTNWQQIFLVLYPFGLKPFYYLLTTGQYNSSSATYHYSKLDWRNQDAILAVLSGLKNRDISIKKLNWFKSKLMVYHFINANCAKLFQNQTFIAQITNQVRSNIDKLTMAILDHEIKLAS